MPLAKIRSSTVSLFVLVTLSACGGSTTYPTFGQVLAENEHPTFDQISPILEFALAQQIQIAGDDADPADFGYYATKHSAIPESGTVNFNGVGSLTANYSSNPLTQDYITIVGDAHLLVDFATEGVSGAVSNMVAFDEDETTLVVSGSYLFSGGHIDNSPPETSPNVIDFNYDVVLIVDNEPLVVSGMMMGQFRGTRPEEAAVGRSRIKSIAAYDFSSVIMTGDGIVSVGASVFAITD